MPLASHERASADSPPPSVAEGLPVTLALRLPTESGGLDDGAPGNPVWGHLEIPNPTIMASSLVPICVIHGSQPGRTALLLAGNHVDHFNLGSGEVDVGRHE